ncbi:MAG: (2Fe-2S)-binding protein [Chloroflexota bacterium]|nr:(2Fe-2S)-binding protein [Chloroflexota bacterium]
MSTNGTRSPDVDLIPVNMTINGRAVIDNVPPQLTLLEFLRDWLGLKGAKRSCDLQVCGACTVVVDGMAVSSCTLLAFEVRDTLVTTIEGLAEDGELHPVQQSFIDNAAFQCGFCTPGMIMAAKSLLDQNPHPNEEEIRAYMKGNICRCTGYKKIVEAIEGAGRDAQDRNH